MARYLRTVKTGLVATQGSRIVAGCRFRSCLIASAQLTPNSVTWRIQLSKQTREPYRELVGETDLDTEQERAALAFIDAMTRLPDTQDGPYEVCAQAVGMLTEDQCRPVAWTITVLNAFS
jgi:hypothetical protein